MSLRPNPAEAPISRGFKMAARMDIQALCGPHHRNLQRLEQRLEDFGLRAESQGGGITLNGEAEGVAIAEATLGLYQNQLKSGVPASDEAFDAAINIAIASLNKGGSSPNLKGLKRPISAQTEGQIGYLSALSDASNGLIFGVGPAGTGKTYLAVAVGASALATGACERLIVARPAVEAGERLGFLPGDLEDKVDPYMLPIWDSLREFFGQEQMERRRAKGEIEVAPLAFMRGRTLKNAYVIIDEAQNATVPQMKMVLTRLGVHSRMVVTGDPSQVDLPSHQPSGLAHALRILDDVKGVQEIRLTKQDVVRHQLVSRIIDAYERDEGSR